MKKSRFTGEQIIGFLKQAEAGAAVKELGRKDGFSDASFYKWRSRFGGMDVADARRLREREGESESGKLKELLAEALFGHLVTQGHCSRKTVSPQARRDAIKSLAPQRRRSGYRRIHALIRREGGAVNRERVQRIYCEEGLQVARRKRRRGVAMERRALEVPLAPNEVCSMDFFSDSLEHARRLKCLTIVDDYTKEAIDIPVGHRISGEYVTRVLDRAGAFRGLPRVLRTDQGPEFTGNASIAGPTVTA